jgi:hypothetical protein
VSIASLTIHDHGWREHPDFSTFSDERLDLAQKLLDEEIAWAEKAGNPILATYKEQEMRMLQAECSRRSGNGNGNPDNSLNSVSSHSVQTFPGSIKLLFMAFPGILWKR